MNEIGSCGVRNFEDVVEVHRDIPLPGEGHLNTTARHRKAADDIQVVGLGAHACLEDDHNVRYVHTGKDVGCAAFGDKAAEALGSGHGEHSTVEGVHKVPTQELGLVVRA